MAHSEKFSHFAVYDTTLNTDDGRQNDLSNLSQALIPLSNAEKVKCFSIGDVAELGRVATHYVNSTKPNSSDSGFTATKFLIDQVL